LAANGDLNLNVNGEITMLDGTISAVGYIATLRTNGSGQIVVSQVTAATIDAQADGRLKMDTSADTIRAILTGSSAAEFDLEIIDDDDVVFEHITALDGSLNVIGLGSVVATYIEAKDVAIVAAMNGDNKIGFVGVNPTDGEIILTGLGAAIREVDADDPDVDLIAYSVMVSAYYVYLNGVGNGVDTGTASMDDPFLFDSIYIFGLVDAVAAGLEFQGNLVSSKIDPRTLEGDQTVDAAAIDTYIIIPEAPLEIITTGNLVFTPAALNALSSYVVAELIVRAENTLTVEAVPAYLPVTLDSGMDLVIKDGTTLATNFDMNLIAGGNITQQDGSPVQVNVAGTLSLETKTGGAVKVHGVGSLTVGKITADGGQLALSSDSGLTIDTINAGLAGTVNLSTAGAVHISGVVKGASLDVAASGEISLKTQVDQLNINNTGATGAISITQNAAGGDLEIGSIQQAAGNTDAINLSTSSGNIVLPSTNTFVARGDVSFTAQGTGADVELGAQLVVPGTVTIHADGGNIIGNAVNGVDIIAQELHITVGHQAGNAAAPLNTQVNVLGASAANSTIVIHNTGDLEIGTDGLNTSDNGDGTIEVITSGNLIVNGDIALGAGGTIHLEAQGGFLKLHKDISTVGGSITLIGDSIEQKGTITTSGAGTITVTATVSTISMTHDTAVTTTESGAISYNATTDVALANLVSASGTINVTAGSGVSVVGAISNNLSAAGINLTTTGLVTLTAETGIGTISADLDTTIETLNAYNLTSGDIVIDESDGLTISVGSIKTQGGNGNIDLTVQAGNLVLDGVLSAHGSGTVTVNVVAGDLIINANTSSTSGAVSLTADNITETVNLTTGGTLDLIARTNLTILDGLTLTASTVSLDGAIQIGSAAVEITDLIITGNLTFKANSQITAEINGLVAGTSYDVVTISGALTIEAGAQLTITEGFTPTGGDAAGLFVGTGPVTGTFTSLPEGQIIVANYGGSGLPAIVSYAGNKVSIVMGPEAKVSVNDVTLAEGSISSGTTAFVFTVSRDNNYTALSVGYAANAGTATVGLDFLTISGTINWTANGALTSTVTVTVNHDTVVEINETFTLNLSNLVGHGQITDNQGLGTITNDDSATLSISAPAITETNVDQTVEFTVTVDAAVQGGFDVAFSDALLGTTIADDYTLVGVSPLSFVGTANESHTIAVTITGDNIVELSETFTITLDDVSNTSAFQDAAITTGDSAQATITDNDTATFTIDDQTVAENGTLTFTISLDNPVDTAVAVDVSYADVAAGAVTIPGDFDHTAGQVTFAALDTVAKTVTVIITDDSIVELSEAFTTSLSTVTALGTRTTVLTDTGTGTITDNDTATFTIDDQTVNEADNTLTFTISLSNPVDTAVVVDVSYADVNAETDDFDHSVDQVLFAALDTLNKTVTVTITDDSIVEDNETFTASLNTATVVGTRTTVLTDSGTGTITDNDTATFTIDDQTVDEAAGTLTFTVSISNPVDTAVVVDVSYADVNAEADDFDHAADQVTFAALDIADKTVTVSITDDSVVEDNEIFTASLSTATLLGTRTTVLTDTGSGTINNNDSATLSISAPTITETDADQTIQFTVTVDAAVEGGFDVAYSDTLGTAEASDYTLVTASPLAFAGNVGESHTISITITGDDIVEDHETFTLTLGDVSNTTAVQDAAITTSESALGTINNDDSATLWVNDVQAVETDPVGTTNFVFTVTLTTAIEGGVSIAIATEDGIATLANNDYATASTTLNFAGTLNEQHQFTVAITGDNTVEADETFDAILGALSNVSATIAATITTSNGVGTIQNDDFPILVELNGDNNLIITDQLPGGADFTTIFKRSGTDLVISDANVKVETHIGTQVSDNEVRIAFADFTGQRIIIDAGDGDDLITVDFSGNDPIPANGILFNGQGQTNGDALALSGGTVTTVTHTFTNANGTVDIDGSLVAYTGLEPIADNLIATNRIFTFNGGAETITLSDDGVSGNGSSKIDSPLSEVVTFANPTASLTVNAGSGDDTVDVTGLDANFGASLNINGDAGADTIILVNALPTLASLSVDAEAININNGAVTTTGSQTYTGPTTLGADAVLTGSLVTFNSTFAGGSKSLTITGNAEFDAAVSGLSSLNVSGTTQLDGGAITSIGTQTYQGAVTQSVDTALSASLVTFNSTFAGGTKSLTITGNAEFDAAATGLSTLNISGTTKLDGGTVSSTGTQTYVGAVTQSVDTALTTSLVTFNSTFAGGTKSLTITGNAEFDAPVSGLQSLVISGTTQLDSGSISSTSVQTYQGAVMQSVDTVLTASLVTFNSTFAGGTKSLTITGNAEFDTPVSGLQSAVITGTTQMDGGSIASIGTQTYQGAVAQSVDNTLTASLATFNDTFAGGSKALAITGNAEFDAVSGLSSLNVSGTTKLDGGSIISIGTQTYKGAVAQSVDTALTGSLVTFNDTFAGGSKSLTITGNAEFDGAVSGLSSLTVSGTTQLDGGANTSTGTQTYQGVVTQSVDTALSASLVTFNSTFAGGTKSLTITGNAEFDAAVSGLSSLNISGTTQLDGGVITSTGTQTYQGAVTQSVDTVLTGSLVTFNSTFAGGSKSLAITGNAEFDAAISGLSTLNVSGTTQLDGDSITSTGTQTYQGAVTQSVDNTLTGSLVTFNSTFAGGTKSLTITGNAGFDAAVSDLSSLNVSGTTQMDGGSVTSTGTQIYQGAVTQSVDTILSSSMVTFNSTFAGGTKSLAITGNAEFDVAVSDLNTLNVSGTTQMDGGSVSSTGTQTYQGAVMQSVDTVLIGSLVTFNSTFAGGTKSLAIVGNAEFDAPISNLQSLAVSGTTQMDGGAITSTGTQTYQGAVAQSVDNTLTASLATFNDTFAGGSKALAITGNAEFDAVVSGLSSLNVSGTTKLDGGSIISIGTQTYKGAVAQSVDTALTGSLVTFNDTFAGGSKSLTITGNAEFDASVSGLQSLVISGTTQLDGASITSTGTQTYQGAVTLGVDNILTGSAATFGNTVNGAYNLNLEMSGTTAFNGKVGGTTPLNSLTITTGGPFTAAYNITTTSNIAITVTDTASTGDDLTVNSGVTVKSNSGAITFYVGDNVTIQSGATVQASGIVSLNADPAASDPDTVGATVNIFGDVIGSVVTVNGGDDVDTFNIQRIAAPTTIKAFSGNDIFNISSDASANNGTLNAIAALLTIDGGADTDTLNVSDLGDTSANSGTLTAATLTGLGMTQGINYTTFETFNLQLSNGADTFTIQSTAASVVTTISGNDGDDIFNVGNAGNSLDDILGVLTINGNAPSASDVLNINDQGDTDDNNYTLTGITLNRTGMAQLTYGTIESLFLNTGTGSDNIILSNTQAGATTVNANVGADTITVQMTSGTTTVNAQAGDDQIIIQTTGAGQSTTVNGDAGQDTFIVQATGLGSTTTLNGGDNADIFNVQTIAGETTLNTGAGNDSINISSDAPANLGTLNGIAANLTINGDADLDTLNISDAGDPANNFGDLTDTQLTGFGMGGTLAYSGFEFLKITLGSGNDQIGIHSTHTPAITSVDAGSGDDTYLIYDGWGDVSISETSGIDTLNFASVNASLIVMIGGGVSVTDTANTLAHTGDSIEHLIGGAGSDWFIMGPGASLAGGTGTITGGPGMDVISYEHYAEYYHRSIYNGVGLAQPADVEIVIFPPAKQAAEDVLFELLSVYGDATSIDALIDLVKSNSGTYKPGSGGSVALMLGQPTAVLTPAGSLVVFSGGIGGTASVADIILSGSAGLMVVQPGVGYLAQSGQTQTFGEAATIVHVLAVSVFTSSGELTNLLPGESIAVIFQIPAHMLGQNMAIMWWNEARGMWQEISSSITPDGRIIAITKCTGTFVLVVNN
jgi:mucin-19